MTLVTFYKTPDRTFVPTAFHHLGLEPIQALEILVRVRDCEPPCRFELLGVIVRVEAGRPPPGIPIQKS